MKVILLEYEINFDFVKKYLKSGRLLLFLVLNKKTIKPHPKMNEHLEPWIQWVSAHTGKNLVSTKYLG